MKGKPEMDCKDSREAVADLMEASSAPMVEASRSSTCSTEMDMIAKQAVGCRRKLRTLETCRSQQMDALLAYLAQMRALLLASLPSS